LDLIEYRSGDGDEFEALLDEIEVDVL